MSSSMLDWFLSTLTPTEAHGMATMGHVPSTAEIIQKCLTVNPFDLKFREANMQQINSGGSQSQGQSPTDQNGLLGSSMGLPPSMLSKLPSLSSQSPGIFSNISVLSTADFDEMRKNIDLTSFSRKVQQLRENKDEASRTGREPRTADVIDGVIDVEFNRNHHPSNPAGTTPTTSKLSSPSNANLVAGLSVAAAAQDFLQAATAYGNHLAAANAAAASGASSMAISCAPSTSSVQNSSGDLSNMIDVLTCDQQQHNNVGQQQQLSCITSTNCMMANDGASLHPNFGSSGFQFSSPTGLRKSTLTQFSHADFAATTAAFLQQQQQKQHSSMASKLPSETLMALHSSTAVSAASSSGGGTNLTVPQIVTTGCSSDQNSPTNASVSSCHGSNSAAISPRSTSNFTELKKASSTADLLLSGISSIESHHSASSAPSTVDPWENSMDVKPTLTNKQISSLQQHPSQSFYHQGRQDNNSPFHPGSSGQEQASRRSTASQRPDKPRKYTRYNQPASGASSADSQVTSTRGGRGRRSLTSEMPPDERRNTILERNKAAAVRYRKRKKEEHDEMISRVQELQNEKTRNEVLVREIERLSNLLKAKDAQCICRANRLGVLGGDGGHEDGIRRPGNSPIDFGMSNIDTLMNTNSSNVNLNQLNTGGFRNK